MKSNLRKHFMYGAWAGMINRCHNKNNASYPRYGGRGIYVCDRWRFGEGGQTGFKCFLDDMGERPEGMTLDRYPDPAGPYAPWNARWATIKEQRKNITQAGDMRMRAATSKAVKKYWAEWRKKNSIRLELRPAEQACLHAAIEGFLVVPEKKMKQRIIKTMIKKGLINEDLRPTAAGLKWVNEGKPKTRKFSPEYLRKLATSLEIG